MRDERIGGVEQLLAGPEFLLHSAAPWEPPYRDVERAPIPLRQRMLLHVLANQLVVPHDRQAQPLARGELFHRALTERLRQRVRVGPPERLRASAPVLDQPAPDPLAPLLFRMLRHHLRPGPPVLPLRPGEEPIE